MLSSNNNQIHSFEKPIQIHDENGNPISRFDQNQQLIDCYNYNNNNFNPFVDEEEFILLYSQKQHQLLSTTNNNFGPEMELEISGNININEETTTQKVFIPSQKKGISKKRSSNKDRHSKISTLRGPRDRRMRLSLEIARNFFNLQDMLGFDKASKTVEWLFAKSRNAIKELKEKYLSGVSFSNDNNVLQIGNKSCGFEEVNEKKKRRKLRVVDKESRYKARARARERTRAKLNLRLEKSKCDFEGNPVGDCKMEDLIEESGTKSKDFSHGQNQEILSDKCENLASLGTVSLDNIKVSPAGLKLLELDEIDRVLIFYGEYESKNLNA